MKVGILTPTLSRTGGGIFPIVAAHARGLSAEAGIDLTLFGVADEFSEADAGELAGVHTISHKAVIPRLGFAPALGRDVERAGLAILHQHGLWQYPSVVARRFSARSRGRVVISTQGMLEPWAIANSRWRKRIAGFLFERANLEAASCLHCSEAEVAGVRSYGLKAPIAVIPNGVAFPEADRRPPPPAWMAAERRTLLFLGRLHPKKGLFELLQAWAALLESSSEVRRGWRLAIAGWDDGGYAAKLREQAARLRMGPESVTFPGGIFGDEKDAALRHAAAFVLPSFSEGLPMSVLEAWSHGLPVLMTRACNLSDAFAHEAAIEVSTDPRELARTLDSALTGEALGRVGANGRRFVEARFAWDAVIRDLRAVYEWLAAAAPRPACVVT
jgi:glycosyltransferase involved in cell wall biosynthesis